MAQENIYHQSCEELKNLPLMLLTIHHNIVGCDVEEKKMYCKSRRHQCMSFSQANSTRSISKTLAKEKES